MMLGKRVSGFTRQAEEIALSELAAAPEPMPVFEALMRAGHDILAGIAALQGRIRAVANRHAKVRQPMTAPGVETRTKAPPRSRVSLTPSAASSIAASGAGTPSRVCDRVSGLAKTDDTNDRSSETGRCKSASAPLREAQPVGIRVISGIAARSGWDSAKSTAEATS